MSEKIEFVDLVVAQLVHYMETLNGYTLYRYQKYEAGKILRELVLGNSAEMTNLWSRQSGKTEMGRLLIMTCMVFFPIMARDKDIVAALPMFRHWKDGFKAGIVGPKEASAAIPFNRIKEALRKTQLKYNLEQLGIKVAAANSQHLVFSNGSHAKAMSGAETSFNEGDSLHYLHFEECQKLSQFKIYKSFHPMLAATGGMSNKVGTPDYVRGAFYGAIQRNKLYHPEWHGEYNWRYSAAENPDYKRYVITERDRIGADSDEFRMSYELEWILTAGMLFDIDLWQSMCGDGKEGRPLIRQSEYSKGHRMVYGLDTAKYKDATVLTIGEVWGRDIHIIDWVYMASAPYEEQWEVITSVINTLGKGMMVVDSTGAGDPSTEVLANRLGQSHVEGLVYSVQSKDTLYKLMRRECQAGRVYYPGVLRDRRMFNRFEQECLECEVDTRGTYMTYHHPTDDDTKRDDHVDSLANLIYAATMFGNTSGTRAWKY